MKAFAIAVLAGAAPLGAVIGACLKLDAKRGWSHRPGWQFILGGAALGLLVFGGLIVYFGAYRDAS